VCVCVCVCVHMCRRVTMSDMQAVLEFQVELFKFFNIDLFQRGSVITHLAHTQS